MAFMDHFKELRKRLTYIVIAFVLFFILSSLSTPYLISLLKSNAINHSIDLNLFKMNEAVTIHIKLMLFQAIILSCPIIVTQIYQYVKPALDLHTQKLCTKIIPVVSLLFLVGSLLGYILIVPLLTSFFLFVANETGLNTMFNFTDYLNLVLTITLIFGLILEVPAFLGFLTTLGILQTDVLRKLRRVSYVVLCVFSLVITPPDFISDLIVTLLMFSLYEISILISSHIEKRREVFHLKKRGDEIG